MADEYLFRRFEPILYFHPQEDFFPSDAKRYLEQCSLWKSSGPAAAKPWTQLILPGEIAATKNEKRSSDTFLGDKLSLNAGEEAFLELSGWEDTNNVGSTHDVSPVAANDYAAIDDLLEAYSTTFDLTAGRFWYHAEAFNMIQIRTLLDTPTFQWLKLAEPFFQTFMEPLLLCYYLFYPAHVEALQGCGPQSHGPKFGNFAGEWNCICILLDRDQSLSIDFQPRYIGLASRNANPVDELITVQEPHLAMSVHDWAKLQPWAGAPDHPRLYVAKGTHGIYLEPGQKVRPPIDPDDTSASTCGNSDFPAPAPADSSSIVDYWKLFAGAALGAGGFLAGLIWSELENPTSQFKLLAPDDEQHDDLPEAGNMGLVLHPKDFVPPDVDGNNHLPWPDAWPDTTPYTRAYNGITRTYTMSVDRTNQVWWPNDDPTKGYRGRWGPLVAHNPADRRSGMAFPDFTSLFFRALARTLSKPAPGP